MTSEELRDIVPPDSERLALRRTACVNWKRRCGCWRTGIDAQLTH